MRKETPALVGRGQPLGDLGSSAALEDAAFALDEKVLSEPLRAGSGYAVLRVVEKKGFDAAAFEREKGELTNGLLQAKRGQFFQAFVRRAAAARRRGAQARCVPEARGLMHVEMRKTGEVVVVDLKGKLTAGLGDQILRESIDELLAENWKKILLNLSQVSFMDSAGIGELVAGLRTAQALRRTCAC